MSADAVSIDQGHATPVAIVGMAVLLPGAPDLDTYWRNLVAGVDSITDVPAHRWDPGFYRSRGSGPAAPDHVYCRRGGFVDDWAEVEVTQFGIMPSSVADAEPDQMIALRVAAAAVADAGGEARLPDRDRVGVILGRGGYLTPGLSRLDQRVRTSHQLVRTLGELMPDLDPAQLERVRTAFTDALGPSHPDAAIGLVPNLAASRVANRLDLRGPAYTVDAACASSLVALDQAIGELAGGRCDLMLAGGVHHCHDITLWSVFSRLGALSASQQIRPFDRRADGILIGEGTAMVALKRLADAERDGDRIYAVVRGSGVASDGRTGGLASPGLGGQVLAVRRAWQRAELDPGAPDSVGLIEAHGTATTAGDRTELATLQEVFGAASRGEPAVIGTVKSMIGHTMATAGAAGLVKAALALHHGVLPPTLHCDEPHPALAEGRFRPIDTARPWPNAPGGVRRAGVNAFGFGGINAHVVLEQAPARTAARARPHVTVAEPARILLLTGSPAALAAALDRPDEELRAAADTVPAAAAGDARLGVVDPTGRRLAVARKAVARAEPWRGRNDIWFSPRPLLADPGAGIAFVFPGLEAEFAPRVDDVAGQFGLPAPAAAADGLAAHGAGVLQVGRLLDTALRRLRVRPDAVAGHSVGEWTAMICAGMHAGAEVDELLGRIDLNALQVPGVEFAVLGCAWAQVAEAIAGRPDLVISHENSPRQTIVCGPGPAVAALVREFRARQVICQVLPFRSGFHTPMLTPYLAPFRAAVDAVAVHPPAVPVWSATTASVFPTRPEEVRELYLRHLVEPVRFASLMRAMHQAGSRVFVQVGPGQLGSLIDDTLKDVEHLTVAANSSRCAGLDQLRRVGTAVWVEGGDPDLAALLPAAPPDPAPVRRPEPVRLDLSGALVRLGPGAGDLLPDRGPVEPVHAMSTSALDAHAERFPLAAELSALLRETERSAAAVLAALPTRTAALPRPAVPPAAVATPQAAVTTLRVSTATMPYLLDHCFALQREGWPDETDRRPVVPATTVVAHMMDAALRVAPGLRAVGVADVRLKRWLVAAPAVDVTVTAAPTAPDRVHVTVGDYASATVVLAPGYPPRPAPWPPSAEPERRPTLDAERFYAERWMFHGPRFQGISELSAVGDRYVRGVFTTPAAPGGLLDNVGQLFGHWIVETQTARRVVFPVAIGTVRWYGPEPAAGTRVGCEVRVRSITDTAYVFDAQLTGEAGVLADITGWQDHRFDSHPDTDATYHFPERNGLSRSQPGGWSLIAERWSTVASRDLYLHKYLNAVERADYERLSPPARRHWALGRIAVKDAVRARLWQQGWGPVFPAEILVRNNPAGRPVVAGHHGLPLPAFSVSIAHTGELAVALARQDSESERGESGVGIDIEQVTERPPATHTVALSAAERELLAGLVAATGEPAALWFTRFWTAKEAAAKAEGTGLGGQPRRFAVTAAAGDELTVIVAGRVHRVRYASVRNPGDMPERDYVVAWTTDPRDTDTRDGEES